MISVVATSALFGDAVVDVAQGAKVRDLYEAVEKATGTEHGSVAVYDEEGDLLDDMSASLEDMRIVEGSAVRVGVSKRWEAKKELERRGLVVGVEAFAAAVREGGQEDVVELFIEAGVAEMTGKDGLSALNAVVLHADEGLVARLLSSGANPTLPDDRGVTPLHRAIGYRPLSIITLLTPSGGLTTPTAHGTTPLHKASQYTTPEALETLSHLLSLGVPVEPRDSRGWTPLHYAACASLEAVQLLLRHGADFAATTDAGQKPIQIAAERRCIDIYTALWRLD